MLNFLAGLDAPLAVRDSDGHTPLYYAKQQGSGIMAKALLEILEDSEAINVSFYLLFILFHYVIQKWLVMNNF